MNKSLEQRHKSEEIFHDEKYKHKEYFPKHYLLNPTVKIFNEMYKMIGNVSGKRVLEYGCGNGWITLELASKHNIRMDTFDISQTAIIQTKNKLIERGLEHRCTVKKMSAEELEYEDSAFDIIFGFAILHHLELKKAISELYRVLKPSGIAFFAEPLGTNPIINLYRKLTPQYRTEDEAPLDLKKMKILMSEFSSVKHIEYYLLSLAPLAIANVGGLIGIAEKLFKLTTNIDRFLLMMLPFLRKFAWYSIIIIKK